MGFVMRVKLTETLRDGTLKNYYENKRKAGYQMCIRDRKKGDKAGSLVYELDGKEIGKVDVIVSQNVKKAGFLDYLKKVVSRFRT